MMKKLLAAIVLSIVLTVGLMPAVALAADGSSKLTVTPMSLDSSTPASAPSKPSTSWIQYKNFSVYEQTPVVYDGTPVGSIKGDYLGEGLAITLQSSTTDYELFTVVASKTKQTPSKLTKYAPDVSGVSVGIAYAGNTFYTNTLEPNTTYYLYVATGNANDPGYMYSGAAWSDWSDPIAVKTPAAKKTELKDNPITVKTKKVTFSVSKLKKKAQSVNASKAFTVKKNQGTVTYKATANVTKNARSTVKVASNGKVTVKKGAKRGTYKLKVKVTAAGNTTYKSGSKTVKLTVKVK